MSNDTGPPRDEVSALVAVFKAGADCAVRWGWTERQFERLARVCYRWARAGEIPRDIDDDRPSEAAP